MTAPPVDDARPQLAGATVLVTGGCGLIGSRIVRCLARLGATVFVLDTEDAYGFDAPAFFGVDRWASARIRGDVADAGILHPLLARSDFVVHAAALADVAACQRDPGRCRASNVLATRALVDGITAYPVRRLVFASSASIYGNGPGRPGAFSESDPPVPISVYGQSKAHAEVEVRDGCRPGQSFTILRYFSVYGVPQVPKPESHSWCVPWFTMRAALGLPLVCHGGGAQVRDFVHVDDVAAATVAALWRPAADRLTLNVGSGRPTTVRRIADEVAHSFPGSVVTAGPRPIGDPLGGWADVSSATRALEWAPAVALGDGIDHYVQWVRGDPTLIPGWMSGVEAPPTCSVAS